MAVTVSEQTFSMVKKITFTWATTGTTSGTSTGEYDGEILRVVCTNTATTGGTVTLTDEDGNDVLLGAGVLTTGTTYLIGSTDGRIPISAIAASPLTFNVASTAAAGTGYCYTYIR